MAVQQTGVRARRRAEVRERIADAAARLASEQGIAATTADDIAAAAGVGRATFFRYFDSKELAIATGLSGAGAYVLAEVLAGVDPALGPLDAVRVAYAALGEDFADRREMFAEQAALSRESAAMLAWTLHLYVDWEIAVADAVAPRFAGLRPGDPRPRMLGALTMAAARLACDAWLADGAEGDLPALIQEHLAAVELPAGAPGGRPGAAPRRTR
ncbi:TetR family transcriptional regulator [Nocardioides humi]|uniref:TetR family transcriptional regulator n=1 Tax=Nocardioides humi TaxID=449461 RepID=A0ABN2ASW7_9ACTN|nr:TetR family transcriptional regulator [Nocardioides humi]